MILRRVVLENFGLYRGTVELDLAPRRILGQRRPVVLVGGQNGAGKTTLLEAVRLALHGRLALGARVAQAEYEAYLRSRVHRPVDAGTRPSGAAVCIEFGYAEDGVVHEYRVRRAWSVRGRSVVESLVLERDASPVTSIPREEWQHFLRDLIPPGVAQLFFFDGEKIREIAEADRDPEQLARAVRGLLGLELVDRLRTDLGLYVARKQHGERGALAARLEATVRDLAAIDERIGAAAEDVAQHAATRDSQARAAEQARRRFVAEGGEIAARRTQLLMEQEETERRIARLQTELREHAGRLLPFAAIPRLAARAREALRDAVRADGGPEAARALVDAVTRWQTSGTPGAQAEWTAGHWADLNVLVQTLHAASQNSTTLGFGPEIVDRNALLSQLEEAETIVRPRLAALAQELEALVASQEEVEAMLLRADGGESSILLDELRRAEQLVGGTEALLRGREDDLRSLRAQRAALERERVRVLEQQAELTATDHRTGLATRAAAALAEYERRLLEHKLSRLREEFLACFRRLARKEDFVSDARIDPETFAVTLFDAHGRELPKSDLSAGEKQVYAVALLWALARTSGRPLPLIIDTPLARLDAHHRASLVERYLPVASHQVVVLSTDAEVDQDLQARLGDSISHTLLLYQNQGRGCTEVRERYFWSASEAEIEEENALQQA